MNQTPFDFERGDDLTDLLGGSERTAPLPQAPEYVRIRETIPEFTETCPACKGSGRFHSRYGRDVGRCFKCEGAGKRTFKTAPAVRQASQTARTNQKVASWQDFATAHPTESAWIITKAPSFDFAANMKAAIEIYGVLTDGQFQAVKRCADRDAQPATASRATEIDCSKIMDAFYKARAAGLRKPKLIIGGLKFSFAPDTGKNRGSLYVKAVRQGDTPSQYLGKITLGIFYPAREATAEQIAAVVTIAADPATAAKAHGLKTCRCSCCGLPLENPESVRLGIGPICRDKYGF